MVSKSRGKNVKGLRAKAVSPKKAKDIRGGAYDSFLKIDGIRGESADSNHKDWIEVLGYKR